MVEKRGTGEVNLDAFNSLSSRGLFGLRHHVVIFEASFTCVTRKACNFYLPKSLFTCMHMLEGGVGRIAGYAYA